MSSEKFAENFNYTPHHWRLALTEIIAEKKIFPIKVGFRSIIHGTEYIIAAVDWSKEEATLVNTLDMKTTLTASFADVFVQ